MSVPEVQYIVKSKSINKTNKNDKKRAYKEVLLLIV